MKTIRYTLLYLIIILLTWFVMTPSNHLLNITFNILFEIFSVSYFIILTKSKNYETYDDAYISLYILFIRIIAVTLFVFLQIFNTLTNILCNYSIFFVFILVTASNLLEMRLKEIAEN
ncbi:hypothetical protein [Aminipila terrae]|uniref:Uncharacterized protein n=1 Tax=Aminipila terrae TaxID=2697030 RepID=A0A6P1MHB4_9FIRM|nr:hypothetical protein [Aminipila terrae]QHI73277.1 hypothetical protein Ami3637_13620 [Aminipila terrae]